MIDTLTIVIDIELLPKDVLTLKRYDDLSTGVVLEIIAKYAAMDVINVHANPIEGGYPFIHNLYDYCEKNYWKEHVSNDDVFEVMGLTTEIYDVFQEVLDKVFLYAVTDKIDVTKYSDIQLNNIDIKLIDKPYDVMQIKLKISGDQGVLL